MKILLLGSGGYQSFHPIFLFFSFDTSEINFGTSIFTEIINAFMFIFRRDKTISFSISTFLILYYI